MTTAHGRPHSDVRRWPDDPEAHRALADYLKALPVDPNADRTSAALLSGHGLDFSGADLSGLDLLGAELSESVLTGVPLVGADLYTAWLVGARLSGADLSGADLRKVQARGCVARQVKVCGADLQRADFSDSDLRGADLGGARLERVSLSDSDLRDVCWRDCVFGRTRLSRARFAGCDATGATGLVIGPVDIGVDSPRLLNGPDLQNWFASNGAPGVEVQ